MQDAPAQKMVEKTARLSTAIAIYSSTREHHPASQITHASSMDLFDQRRLQIELGPGGDHDTLYSFSLPIYTPQLQAWTRMLVRMQEEGLPS